jgi:transposase
VKSSDVGAYLGPTPCRYQSGELDRTGRISKRRDCLTRLYLFEAASVLLSVVAMVSLESLGVCGWPMRRHQESQEAKTAVARELAVVLYCIWIDGTEFQWSKEKA